MLSSNFGDCFWVTPLIHAHFRLGSAARVRGLRMQSFGLDRAVVAGLDPRVTAFAGGRFLDVMGERPFPEWSGRPV